MADDRLVKLVDNWEDIAWITKRHIEWKIIKTKYHVDRRAAISTMTIITMISVILGESHVRHLVLLLSTLAILHFYVLLTDNILAHR